MKITAIRAYAAWVGISNQLPVKVEPDAGVLLECRSTPTEALGFDDREFFPVQVAMEGASYIVPDGPGLGVEVDEARPAPQEFRFWEAPHLRRNDGSYTNW